MKHRIAGVCLILFIVMLSQNASAQSIDSLKARYNNETLHFFKGYIAKGEDGTRVRFRQLKNEFTLSPEGFKQYESYRKKRTTAFILVSTGFASALAGAIILDNGNKNRDIGAQKLGRGFIAAGYSIEFVSLLYALSGQKKLHRAIWLRNRDVVFLPK
jgi:hypothetical protein